MDLGTVADDACIGTKQLVGPRRSVVGGWQWSASTGTDAAPYFRIMNPTLQESSHCLLGQDYPLPIVDHQTAKTAAIAKFRLRNVGAETAIPPRKRINSPLVKSTEVLMLKE